MGFSSSTAVGATLRRCKISGASSQGIEAYTKNITLEDVLVENVQDDGIAIGAHANNGYRAGGYDVLRRVSIVEPGLDTVGALGDAFQTFAASNRFESSLLLESIYIYKSSAVKQGIVVNDMTAGFTLRNFHFDGGDTGTVQVLFGGPINGAAQIYNGYVRNGCQSNTLFRLGTSGTDMDSAATIDIWNVVHDSQIPHAGFFSVGAGSAATIEGAITLHNNVMTGGSNQGLSFSAMVSCHAGGGTTLGETASLSVKNNLMICSGVALRLPVGGGDDARWVIEGNSISEGSVYAIGSTTYADLASFEAAHSAADANTDTVQAVSPSFRPLVGSTLLADGVDIGYLRDIRGFQSKSHIGAYGNAALLR